MISVIIPVLNEDAQIQKTLASVAESTGNDLSVEVIVVDGGSTDNTLGAIEAFKAQSDISISVVMSPNGRSKQMNAGAVQAKGQWLLFLHADTLLPKNGLHAVTQVKTSWGRFDIHLSSPKLWARIISFMINRRSRLTGIATGDQAIFIKRKLFEEIKGFPNQPLMEDIELSKLLLAQSQNPSYLNDKAITSARRWQKHGVIKTVLLMWSLRWQYSRGVSAEELYKQYY